MSDGGTYQVQAWLVVLCVCVALFLLPALLEHRDLLARYAALWRCSSTAMLDPAKLSAFLREAHALSADAAADLVCGRKLVLWASVHAGGSAHPYHSHRDALVSGVYFVDCPDGAGDFIAGSPAAAPAAGTLPSKQITRSCHGASGHCGPSPGSVPGPR